MEHINKFPLAISSLPIAAAAAAARRQATHRTRIISLAISAWNPE